jgi:hypothetical protein
MSEAATVVPLDPRRRRGKQRNIGKNERPCPEHFDSAELRDLLKWGMGGKYALEELIYGFDRVKNWARGNGAMRVDWVAVTQNAIMGGWGRAGYGNWLARRNRSPRTITPELIEQLVEERRGEYTP